MYPKGSSIESDKVIGIWRGRLYRFCFQSVGALVSSVEDTTQTTSDNRDLCELWHRRMAHLHHGALSILKQITTGVPKFNTEHYDVCRGCAMGKYKGYEVTFRGGHVVMYLVGSSVESGKVIWIRQGRLYRFCFQSVGALVCSVEDTT